MREEVEDIKKMANTLRKAADAADKIAEIAEDEQLTDEEQEEQMELAMAEFVVHMMKLQKYNDIL